jgi:hypothetical protein
MPPVVAAVPLPLPACDEPSAPFPLRSTPCIAMASAWAWAPSSPSSSGAAAAAAEAASSSSPPAEPAPSVPVLLPSAPVLVASSAPAPALPLLLPPCQSASAALVVPAVPEPDTAAGGEPTALLSL